MSTIPKSNEKMFYENKGNNKKKKRVAILLLLIKSLEHDWP